MGFSMDKEVILIVVSIVLSMTGFVGAFAINRLAKAIDSLVESDSDLQGQLSVHKEDLARNYVRHDRLDRHKEEHQRALTEIKQDVVGRIDRMESSFKEALYAHEHREMQAMFNQQQANMNKGV